MDAHQDASTYPCNLLTLSEDFTLPQFLLESKSDLWGYTVTHGGTQSHSLCCDRKGEIATGPVLGQMFEQEMLSSSKET